MGADGGGDTDREPSLDPHGDRPGDERTRAVIARYAGGEISAMQAASLLGGRTTVADVVVMLVRAGYRPPEPPPERQRAELVHAFKVWGLGEPPEPR